MANDQTLFPLTGTAVSGVRLNIRKGKPNTTAPIDREVDANTSLPVIGFVQGEMISGNDKWYVGNEDTFFWSGGIISVQSSSANVQATASVKRRPDGSIRPLSVREIKAVYFDFDYTDRSDGSIEIEPGWSKKNIVELETPVLDKVFRHSVQVHEKALEPFRRVFERIERSGLNDKILTFDGTFVPRHMAWNSKRDLSPHSWGIAIDLNVRWNAYGHVPTGSGLLGSLHELVPHFEAEGFAWGGYFTPITMCDGMHFELARTDL
jgi:hypothetical protein